MTKNTRSALGDARAYALGKRVADLADTRRSDGPGRALDLILAELEARHDYTLMQRVIDELDAADADEAAQRDADERRLELARRGVDNALTVRCETCGAAPGLPCLNRAGTTTRPHAKRIAAGREQHR